MDVKTNTFCFNLGYFYSGQCKRINELDLKCEQKDARDKLEVARLLKQDQVGGLLMTNLYGF